MNENENLLTIVDENGSEILCRILYTFHSEDFNKSYVYYVPVETKDDEEDVEVFCSSFIPQDNGAIGQLQPIENDDEWDMVEEMFNTEFPESDYDDFDEDEDMDDDEDECGCGCHHDDEDDDEECQCGHEHHNHK